MRSIPARLVLAACLLVLVPAVAGAASPSLGSQSALRRAKEGVTLRAPSRAAAPPTATRSHLAALIARARAGATGSATPPPQGGGGG